MPFINQFIEEECASRDLKRSFIPAHHPESYAQAGEDLIVAAMLLANMRLQGRNPSTIRYIEIGANHPVSTSNTYLLYRRYGAEGLLVEADPNLVGDLKSVRPRDVVIHTAVSASRQPKATLHMAHLSELSSLNRDHVLSFGDYVGRGGIKEQLEVPNMHINDLLEKHSPYRVDFLSIDTEGLDLAILSEMDTERYAPEVIQCEPSEHFTSRNGDAIVERMQRKSYRLAAATEINLIFARTGY